jgi:hypothetical protein
MQLQTPTITSHGILLEERIPNGTCQLQKESGETMRPGTERTQNRGPSRLLGRMKTGGWKPLLLSPLSLLLPSQKCSFSNLRKLQITQFTCTATPDIPPPGAMVEDHMSSQG